MEMATGMAISHGRDSLYTGSTRQQLSVCVPVGILALVKLPSVHQAAFTCSVASVSPSACFTLL